MYSSERKYVGTRYLAGTLLHLLGIADRAWMVLVRFLPCVTVRHFLPIDSTTFGPLNLVGVLSTERF